MSVSADSASGNQPSGAYRPAIDGLRGIAVLAVCLFHLNRSWLPGGFVGVDVFFVISGYLITSIILRDCERNRFSFARFYQRRIARLLAAFAAVAVVTILAASVVYSRQDLASTGATLAAAAASAANLKLMFQGNYFVLSPDAQPFLHTWSLSVEEQFYLLFPAAFVLLYRKSGARLAGVLTALAAASFLLCIGLTRARPEWAFYLLPARAWELLAGATLARSAWNRAGLPANLAAVVPTISLLLVGASFFLISEGPHFPGYVAALPVVGTIGLLVPTARANGLAERILSFGPLVLVGRMSYSIYLWHWPVFSLVDYRYYLASSAFRMSTKALATGVASTAGFLLVEQPSKRPIAFAALAASLAVLVPLGVIVRRNNYIDASLSDIAHGGLLYNGAARSGSVVLMGDSNASMYATMLTELVKDADLRLSVVSVAAGDPLPALSGADSALWSESLAAVRRERPDYVIYVARWIRLGDELERLRMAMNALKPLARRIILITQPPQLPAGASREQIRSGVRPPFFEDPEKRSGRQSINQFVKSFRGDNVLVIDVESLFSEGTGGIRFSGDDGKQFYQDREHLSFAGASVVRASLMQAITAGKGQS